MTQGGVEGAKSAALEWDGLDSTTSTSGPAALQWLLGTISEVGVA